MDTTHAKSNVPSGFPPDEERLARIERSGRRMEGPPGLDYDAIVRESFDAYWRAREASAKEAEPFSWAVEARSLHLMIADRIQTWRGYWLDVAWSVGVGVLVAGVSRAWLASGRAAAIPWLALALMVVCVVASLWLYQRGTFRTSMGAFAGTLLACALVWWSSTSVAPTAQTTRALVDAELRLDWLNVLAGRVATGEFPQLDEARRGVRVGTELLSANRAVYVARVSATDRLVADLRPSSGTVSWADTRGDSATALFAGRVLWNREERFAVELEESGEKVEVNKGQAVLPPLSPGQHVVGAYDQKTGVAVAVIGVPSPR